MTEFERRTFHRELEIAIALRQQAIRHRVFWFGLRLAVVLIGMSILIVNMTK